MNLKTTKTGIVSALEAVQPAARSPVRPILQNVHLRATSDEVVISATNIEIAIRARAEAEVIEQGEAVVDAALLFGVCRAAPDEAIVFRFADGRLTVTSGAATSKLYSADVSDFPSLDFKGNAPLSLSGADLAKAIKQVVFCQPDSLIQCPGAQWLVVDGRLTIRVTDGRRLAIAEAPLSRGGDCGAALVTRAAMGAIARLVARHDDAVSIGWDESRILINAPGIQFSAQLWAGHFPPVERVMPTDAPIRFVVSPSALLSSVERMSVFSHDPADEVVKLSLRPNELELTAGGYLGEARDVLATDYQGDPITIAFAIGYLHDLRHGVGTATEIHIDLTAPDKPALFTAGTWRYVLMPREI